MFLLKERKRVEWTLYVFSQSYFFCFETLLIYFSTQPFEQEAEEKLKEVEAAAKWLDDALMVSMVPPNLRVVVQHTFCPRSI
jgi:hypothetical protein